MKILEYFYNQPLRSVKFINRKMQITSPKTLIIGGFGSGKTTLVCEYLANFKQDERLYINLSDLRAKSDEILLNLSEFLSQKPNIKAVCIDNASMADFHILTNLNTEILLITTADKTAQLSNFTKLNLPYLDYEEFIAFFRKNLDADMLFSHYLAHGRIPKNTFTDTTEVSENIQNLIQKALDKTTLNVLRECAKHTSENISVYEIFKELKERIKVSKDSVYASFAELQNIGMINLIEKFNEPNAAKRLFFSDFAMRNALSFKKDFNKNFLNVVFCELDKFNEQIFYTKELDFFLNKRKLAIICNPFSEHDLLILKFKKLHATLKKLGVKKLQIISVANQGEMAIEGIKCEIVPFSQWALSIDF
ncbi:ATP-binding protein [Campylobacter suis]|uniref:ATP-binding protein n=1 Tax=Campylobacter suis TaxID=2790657 RepID=A0ABN7K6G0_9BACT|nr:ATP-binding protein [Campylobacter suis]CAD7288062.1 hypothetical protein LMG8286_01119 [Campylobacter suis]